MDKIEFETEMEVEFKKVIEMATTDNLRLSLLEYFRKMVQEYCEDTKNRTELNRAEALKRRDASKRKATEEMAAQNVKRFNENEIAEIAELIEILKSGIDCYDDFSDDEIIDEEGNLEEPTRADSSIPTDLEDLGFRAIDTSFNWYSAINKYPGIQNQTNFIQKQKESYYRASGDVGQSTYISLNPEQTKVLEFVRKTVGTNNTPRCAMIMGAAGTGKSCIIQEIVNMIGKEKVLLMAPTGVAAINIGGQTIHSALRLSINTKVTYSTVDVEPDLQEQLSTVEVIIIDEFSMIGLSFLDRIDQRLRQARPERKNEILGGYMVLLFGDYNQLQPVGDSPLYAQPNATNDAALRGKSIYKAFSKTFFLKQIMRQTGNDQEAFRNTLTRLATGKVTHQDYQFLSSRFLSKNKNLSNDFKDAIRLMAKNNDIDLYNYEKLRQVGKPVTVLKAIHNNKIASLAKRDQANGLETELQLCVGAMVILRKNLWVACGLCNGSIGEIVDIVYEKDETAVENTIPSTLPLCVLVKFTTYTGPTLFDGVIPILPVTVTFNKSSTNCSRTQFPLTLAYAISIHRSQGLTLEKAVVDIGKNEFSLGISYVACSRVKKIDGLLFQPDFTEDRLLSINYNKEVKPKRLEMERLKTLQQCLLNFKS